jgi:hypothetical protein
MGAIRNNEVAGVFCRSSKSRKDAESLRFFLFPKALIASAGRPVNPGRQIPEK